MSTIINTKEPIKKLENFWNSIHFHPTDAIEDDWGRRILDDVANDKVADTVRMYAMLEDIVTEKDGKLFYDFTENDVRLDYMVQKGFDVLLSYSFIPPFLANNDFLRSSVSKNKTRYKGKMIVASYPKDYAVWQEICRVYTEHILERYGADTVSRWYLQCYNEPDHSAFFMKEADEGRSVLDAALVRSNEYIKLYDGFSKAIELAEEKFGISGKLCIGGPAIAGNALFLENFLKSCVEKNTRIDFACFHTYGTHPPLILTGELPLDVKNNCKKYDDLSAIVRKYLPNVKIIIDEWGACSAGFANIEEAPQLIFRETETFACYFGKLVTRLVEKDADIKKLLICLSGQHEMTEDFSGFRGFFTLNHIRKPIYNAYALMRKLGDTLLSHSALPENMTLLATQNDDGKYTLLFTYSSDNFDKKLPDVSEIVMLPDEHQKKKVTIYKIDENHLNPYRVYLEKGFDKDLSEEQIQILKDSARLCPCEIFETGGKRRVEFEITMKSNSFLLCEIE